MTSNNIVSIGVEQERRLLARALGRDPQSVRELVRYLEPKLLLRANALLSYRRGAGAREEAMDLVQAAWRELVRDDWNILRRWEPQRGVRLQSYVGVVASNRMISELRKGQRQSEETAMPPEELSRMAALVDSLEDQVSDRQWLEVIITELRSRLTGQGMQAFELLYLEDLSVEEAMAQTSLTRSSLYSYRRRIKQLVRDIADEVGRQQMDGASLPAERLSKAVGTKHE